MANYKHEQRVLIRQQTLPLFSVPCSYLVRGNDFNKQNCTQLHKCTILGVTPNFSALHTTLCSSKIIVNLLLRNVDEIDTRLCHLSIELGVLRLYCS